MVRCKNCGFKFPSFTQMHEVAFETAVLTNTAEECPGCSELLSYSKKDYFLNDKLFDLFLSRKDMLGLYFRETAGDSTIKNEASLE